MQLCEDAALQVGSDPHTCVGRARAVKEGEALRLRGDGPLSFPSGPELFHTGIKNCCLADREGALKGEDAGCERRGGSQGGFLRLCVDSLVACNSDICRHPADVDLHHGVSA